MGHPERRMRKDELRKQIPPSFAEAMEGRHRRSRETRDRVPAFAIRLRQSYGGLRATAGRRDDPPSPNAFGGYSGPIRRSRPSRDSWKALVVGSRENLGGGTRLRRGYGGLELRPYKCNATRSLSRG
jgi:hypothetical protein